ncbi:hypothetical protein [Shewanella benthica]|uniref:hypothetical protein n=1 Tax=Shewanella benthica TaxID=43661 RepID=UPI001E5FE674|nr:hypothetical protein [Shewanella benthica]
MAVTSSILTIGLRISTIAKVVTGAQTNVASATIEMMLVTPIAAILLSRLLT